MTMSNHHRFGTLQVHVGQEIADPSADNTVRLPTGTEHVDDLIEDLENDFNTIR